MRWTIYPKPDPQKTVDLAQILGVDAKIASLLVQRGIETYDEAKKYFLEIETGTSDLLKDEARFALAIIYEDTNDTASSLKMYEKIVNDHENSIYRNIAESKIKVVQ